MRLTRPTPHPSNEDPHPLSGTRSSHDENPAGTRQKTAPTPTPPPAKPDPTPRQAHPMSPAPTHRATRLTRPKPHPPSEDPHPLSETRSPLDENPAGTRQKTAPTPTPPPAKPDPTPRQAHPMSPAPTHRTTRSTGPTPHRSNEDPHPLSGTRASLNENLDRNHTGDGPTPTTRRQSPTRPTPQPPKEDPHPFSGTRASLDKNPTEPCTDRHRSRQPAGETRPTFEGPPRPAGSGPARRRPDRSRTAAGSWPDGRRLGGGSPLVTDVNA